MFHPCCRPISHPSHLLAREGSDFISPMKLLAAGAVCTVRHCASSAPRDEGGGRMGELSWQSSGKTAVAKFCPGSQGIPADVRDDEQVGKCTHRLFRLVPLGGVAQCQILLCVQNPAGAPGPWQLRPPPAFAAPQLVLEAAHFSALLACAIFLLVIERVPHLLW